MVTVKEKLVGLTLDEKTIRGLRLGDKVEFKKGFQTFNTYNDTINGSVIETPRMIVSTSEGRKVVASETLLCINKKTALQNEHSQGLARVQVKVGGYIHYMEALGFGNMRLTTLRVDYIDMGVMEAEVVFRQIVNNQLPEEFKKPAKHLIRNIKTSHKVEPQFLRRYSYHRLFKEQYMFMKYDGKNLVGKRILRGEISTYTYSNKVIDGTRADWSMLVEGGIYLCKIFIRNTTDSRKREFNVRYGYIITDESVLDIPPYRLSDGRSEIVLGDRTVITTKTNVHGGVSAAITFDRDLRFITLSDEEIEFLKSR